MESRPRTKFILALACFASIATFSCGGKPVPKRSAENAKKPASELPHIKLPPGFRIEYFARNVPNARGLARGDSGTIFVGSRSEGNVYALPDRDGNFIADEVITIAKDIAMPVGVAFRDGDLYFSGVDRILRLRGIESRLKNPGNPEIVSKEFPSDKHHGWKFIAFGPDGKLYVPVGAPCNICLSKDPRYASIMRMNPDGTSLELFASGIRNTVGFDWHPVTKELWFTDNGRDMLGDDLPPDELNRAAKAGLHFGYPHWHGRAIPDPEFGENRSAKEFTLPEQELGAHVAALGMRFYSGKMFPKEYRGAIFIAEHGSWNRSKKSGYRISIVKFDKDRRATSYETFIEGWLQTGIPGAPGGKGEKVLGRPVDLLVLPDGSLLISDDHAGAVYRVTYTGK